jgi:hypothetical protein
MKPLQKLCSILLLTVLALPIPTSARAAARPSLLRIMSVLPASTPQPDPTPFPQVRQGFLACDEATLRREPAPDAARMTTLRYASVFDVLAESGGWYQILYIGSNKSHWQGWIEGDGLLVDPDYFEAAAPTAALAAPNLNAARLGILEPGDRRPILGESDTYYIISWSGASAFVRKP